MNLENFLNHVKKTPFGTTVVGKMIFKTNHNIVKETDFTLSNTVGLSEDFLSTLLSKISGLDKNVVCSASFKFHKETLH